MMPMGSITLDHFHDDFETAGFTRMSGGRAYWVPGYVFSLENGWGVLTSDPETIRSADRPCDLGEPGLWKRIVDPKTNESSRIFELPPQLIRDADPRTLSSEIIPGLAECLRWALDTAEGNRRDDWSPPPRESIEPLLSGRGLTFETGSILRQGALVQNDTCLALRVPVVTAPRDMGTTRADWLEELLFDAQNRWHMVRAGMDDGDAIAYLEVDLSGAPVGAIETLMQAGLDALRCVMDWLVRSADFLVGATSECRALEVCTPRDRSR